MPFFKSKASEDTRDDPNYYDDRGSHTTAGTQRKSSIFSSNRNRDSSPNHSRRSHSPGPAGSHRNANSSGSGGGLFNRQRRHSTGHSSSSGVSRSSGGGAGFLSFGGNKLGRGNRALDNDPSIVGARQKVADAETAEREADRALNEARESVREAREHVRLLEREAIEDARRAKAKQAEAKIVSKSARGLGRHGK